MAMQPNRAFELEFSRSGPSTISLRFSDLQPVRQPCTITGPHSSCFVSSCPRSLPCTYTSSSSCSNVITRSLRHYHPLLFIDYVPFSHLRRRYYLPGCRWRCCYGRAFNWDRDWVWEWKRTVGLHGICNVRRAEGAEIVLRPGGGSQCRRHSQPV